MTEEQLKKIGVDLDRHRAEGRVKEALLLAVPQAPPSAEDERQSEKAFQAEVVKFAKARRWRVYHTYDSRRSAPGFLDLFMVRDGRIVQPELKTETGTTSAAQDSWLEDLRAVEEAARALAPADPIYRVFLWRPSDWPQIQEVLK